MAEKTSPEPETAAFRHRPEDDSDGDAEAEKAEESPQPAGSLPQTPEREKYLKRHFETLADAAAAEGNGTGANGKSERQEGRDEGTARLTLRSP
nr:PREDICTED: WD repeat-containing protein 62-like [Apteryx mantelli mantelli]